MSFEGTALLLAWIAIMLLSFAMAGLLRQIQVLRMGMRGPGRLGPALGARPLASLPGGRPWSRRTVMLFLDRRCETCTELLPQAEAMVAPGMDVVAVYAADGDGFTNGALTVLSNEAELFERFRITVTPFAVVLDESGSVSVAEPIPSVARFRALVGSSWKDAE